MLICVPRGRSLGAQVSITLRKAQATGVLPVVGPGLPAVAAVTRVLQDDVGRLRAPLRPAVPGAESDMPREADTLGQGAPSSAEPATLSVGASTAHKSDIDR